MAPGRCLSSTARPRIQQPRDPQASRDRRASQKMIGACRSTGEQARDAECSSVRQARPLSRNRRARKRSPPSLSPTSAWQRGSPSAPGNLWKRLAQRRDPTVAATGKTPSRQLGAAAQRRPDFWIVAHAAVKPRLLLWELVGPTPNIRDRRSCAATQLRFRGSRRIRRPRVTAASKPEAAPTRILGRHMPEGSGGRARWRLDAYGDNHAAEQLDQPRSRCPGALGAHPASCALMCPWRFLLRGGLTGVQWEGGR